MLVRTPDITKGQNFLFILCGHSRKPQSIRLHAYTEPCVETYAVGLTRMLWSARMWC